MHIDSQTRKSIGAMIYKSYFVELQKLGATLPDSSDPGAQQSLMEQSEQLAQSIAELIENQGAPAGGE